MLDMDHPDWHPPLNDEQKDHILVCVFEVVTKIQKVIPNAFLDYETEIKKTLQEAIYQVSRASRQRRDRARLEYGKKMIKAAPLVTTDSINNLRAQIAESQQTWQREGNNSGPSK